MRGERVVVVIPALDEERTIGDVVAGVRPFVDEVLVIDDGSTDETSRRARAAGATVYRHPTNQGYDRSIETGFRLAADRDASVVVTFDADGQHLADDLPAVLDPILYGGADVVVGQRPRRARAAERLFARYMRSRFGIHDPLCGLKAYRIEVYLDVGYFDEHSSIGTRLTVEAITRGYDVDQVSIRLAGRGDQPRFGQRLEANWKILRAMARILWLDWRTTVSSR